MHAIEGQVSRWLGALPHGDRLKAMQGRLASFAEQGLQGVANVLVNAILARGLTRAQFAVIGLMLGVHYFLLGLHRTAIVLPFILDASSDGEPIENAEGRWWWLNLVSLAAFAALIALLAGAVGWWTRGVPADRWFVQGILLSAMVSPALMFFEFGRRLLYQHRLPTTAALCSAVYLVLNLGSAWALVRATHSPYWGALSWVIAAVGATAIATWAAPPGRPSLRAGFRLWWANRSFALWQALTNFPFAVYNSSVVVLVGIFGGANAAAAFTATRTLANPANSMVTAVDSLDKPRAARSLASGGIPAMRRSIGRTRRLLVLLCGGYLGLVVIFAGPLLRFAFGATYANQVGEIRVLALALFLVCLNQPSETLLIVLRASRLMLATRIVTAIVCVALLGIGARHGLMGICVVLFAIQLLNLAQLTVAERIAERLWTRARAVPAAEIVAVETAP